MQRAFIHGITVNELIFLIKNIFKCNKYFQISKIKNRVGVENKDRAQILLIDFIKIGMGDCAGPFTKIATFKADRGTDIILEKTSGVLQIAYQRDLWLVA